MFKLPRIFSRKSEGGYELLRELLKNAQSKTGVNVTHKTAMQAVTWMACARVIADGIAQVPFKLLRENNGRREPAKDHQLYELLSLKPNDWQTSFEFREMLALHLFFCHNAYVWKNRVNGKIVELLPFEPGQVTVTRVGWESRYRVRVNDKESVSIPAEDIWHIRGPSWNGWKGLDAVALAREAIGLSLATEEHGAHFFSNAATPNGLLTTDGPLTTDQAKALRSSWEETQLGTAKHKTAILWGGLKFMQMSANNVDSQFIEARRFQVEEVCRAARVMPIMIGYADKTTTYASAEQMFQAHAVHTLGPWHERLQQSADVNLLTKEERQQQGLYTKFTINALMRGTATDRAEFYAKLYSVGGISPNEIRALEDMNPYDGGNEYRVPLNMEQPGDTKEPANSNEAGDDNAKA